MKTKPFELLRQRMAWMREDPFLWVDIETTGLDAYAPYARILEIGLAVTDHNLVLGDSIVVMVGPAPVDAEVELWDPFVQKMHTENGLIRDLRDAGRQYKLMDADTVAFQLADWVKSRFGDTKPIIAGASIRLDRAFGELFMPALFSRFHYRQADVSALREFCQRWLPGCSDQEINAVCGKRDIHRPMADLVDSIALASFLKGRMQRGVGDGSTDLGEFNISDPFPGS